MTVDNLMLAPRLSERHADDYESRYERAETALLANAEFRAEWLHNHCVGRTNVNTNSVCRVTNNRLEQFIETCDVPELFALTRYPRDTVRLLALKELDERFLKEHEDYIAQMADQERS